MFTKEDLQQIKGKGIELKTIEKQIENFKKGFPFVQLLAPATVENGISRLTRAELKSLSSLYAGVSPDYRLLKFVPASGAASRMFKDLSAFYELLSRDETIKLKIQKSKFKIPEEVIFFLDNISKFPFYKHLKNVLAKNSLDLDKCILEKDFKTILHYLLTDDGLRLSRLPKAMLHFHSYGEHTRKAFEEHLIEGAFYCRDKDGRVSIHFTLPDDMYDSFISEADAHKKYYEKEYDVKYDLSFSVQKPTTDIIAVDLANNPYRDSSGSLVFRPGGHGALIENLNDCNADIVFIKNIDNIVPDRLMQQTVLYKKALGGMLIHLQQKLAQYLEMLESNSLNEITIRDIEEFATAELNLRIEGDYKKYTRINKINYLYFLLNRPLRICGMVRNTGEQGGGPFWIREASGSESLQIVESSQVNFDDKEQYRIFRHSTHFNPVDLVCFVRDYKGNKFDLTEYIDESTGFISLKSKDGRDLKAQELPGLWNGAMADWITLFVEVPLITFSPVKTVNDLLRPEHQEHIEMNNEKFIQNT
jgi:hypothetical protein